MSRDDVTKSDSIRKLSSVKLHLGGTERMPGWKILNIQPGPDIDIVADCRDLSMFEDSSVSDVYVSHVLEHMSHQGEIQQVLNEICRVLQVGGEVKISVPNLAILLEIFQSKDSAIGTKWGVVNILYGGQSNPFDYHKVAFDYDLISHFLRQAGFSNISQVETFGLFKDASCFSYAGRQISLNIQATKENIMSINPTSQVINSTSVGVNNIDGADDRLMGPLFSIPQKYLAQYCMQGKVPIYMHFLYETSGGTLNWSQQYWNSIFPKINQLINNEISSIGYSSDPHLISLFSRHKIEGKNVVVVGSVHPLYEAIVAHFGGIPSTVEYRQIVHDIPGLQTYTVDEFKTAGKIFDCAVSISSIEHDGLGRYGDPIDPDGDLATMRSYKSFIKKGGLLFLSVPVGQDAVCWNAHRIYGRHRLPKLLEGWRLIDQSGFDNSLFDIGAAGTDFAEPVFVLENI